MLGREQKIIPVQNSMLGEEEKIAPRRKSRLAAIHCYPGVYRVIPKKKINIASILKPEQRKG
jgi:hypothetical protein